MRIHRGYLSWGVFLVLVGAVPLAVRAGYVDPDQIPNVLNLWPLILIGIGVGIILARTRLAFFGGLVVAATLGLMVGGFLAGGFGGIGAGTCGSGGSTVPFPASEGSFADTSGSIDIELSCGNASISMAAGDAWHVAGQDRDGAGPEIEADGNSLSVHSRHDGNGLFAGLNDRESWEISLPDASLLNLDLTFNAGSSTLDLAGASIDTVDLTLNAGSTTLDLRSVRALGVIDLTLNAGSLDLTLPNQTLRGSIQANAGAVRLCAPEGAALRLITNESIVASYDFGDRGLVKVGSTWETPGFDTAGARIELDTRANAGSFSLNPEEGCGG